jgi:hypothetical protein
VDFFAGVGFGVDTQSIFFGGVDGRLGVAAGLGFGRGVAVGEGLETGRMSSRT